MTTVIKIPNRINVIAILTYIVFLTPFVMQITGNNYVKLIEDTAYLVLLLHSVYIMLLQNKIYIQKNVPVILLFILFVIFTFIGIYYNGLTLVILQYREFKYLLLLIILLPYANQDYFKPVWTAVKLITAVSIPVSILQRILYKDNGDLITGLYGHGASGTLTLIILIVFFTELGIRLQNNKRVIGAYFLYLIPTAINETKITYILFPVMLFVILFITKKLKSRQTIIILLISVVMFFIWAAIYEKTYSWSIADIFSSENIDLYLYATHWEGDAGRFAKVAYAYDIIKNTNLFFGYGLGASYLGATSGIDGYISSRFYTREMFGGTKPQLFLSLIDMGLVGTLLILIILVIYFIKLLRRKERTIEFFIALTTYIVLFSTFIYQQIFYTYQIMFIFMLYNIIIMKNKDTGN